MQLATVEEEEEEEEEEDEEEVEEEEEEDEHRCVKLVVLGGVAPFWVASFNAHKRYSFDFMFHLFWSS